MPGFVDIHVHGGGGHTFTTGDADAARAAAGVPPGATAPRRCWPAWSARPLDLMLSATTAYAPLVDEGVLAGIHFEGPYLSRGALRRAESRVPARPVDRRARRADRAGDGAVRMVTLAPELPGALDAIRLLVERGVVAAIGHTDATYEQIARRHRGRARPSAPTCSTACARRTTATPARSYALLGSPGVICELVADGVHLHDGTLAFASSGSPARTRAALITDAMAAAGMPDGTYELGGQAVIVADRRRPARIVGCGDRARSPAAR